jgi:hypothetical protein
VNKREGVIQNRLLAVRVLAFQRKIEARISKELAERDVLERVVADTLDLSRATLRFSAFSNKSEKRGVSVIHRWGNRGIVGESYCVIQTDVIKMDW